MLIDFNAMDETALPSFKGGEGALHARMFADPSAKILKARLSLGSTVGLHTHDTSCEIIFVLSGTAIHTVDGVEETLTAGTCGYCPKGSAHTLVTTSQEDLVFYAAVPEL